MVTSFFSGDDRSPGGINYQTAPRDAPRDAAWDTCSLPLLLNLHVVTYAVLTIVDASSSSLYNVMLLHIFVPF